MTYTCEAGDREIKQVAEAGPAQDHPHPVIVVTQQHRAELP
jgi:hypothetical protein